MRKRQLYERISMHEFGPDGRHAFEALLGAQEKLGSGKRRSGCANTCGSSI